MKRMTGIVAMVFLCGAALAMRPPRPGELDRYRDDGTLAARAARAREIGNHRMRSDLVARARVRLREARRDALAEAGLLPKPLASERAPLPDWQGMPPQGTNRIVVFLIRFPDYTNVTAAATVNSRVDGAGTATNFPYDSLRNYYQRSSYGKLTIRGTTLGWYTMQHVRSWYTTQYGDGELTISKIVEEAAAHFNATTDYSAYDNNHDGDIDMFYVVWSGPDEGWDSFWWSYQWELYEHPLTLDGVTFRDFVWQAESDSPGAEFTPQTMIHETGHALGLPDYYDYDSTIGAAGGCGGLDMMDGAEGEHCAFSKFMLEWLTPAVVTAPLNDRALRALGLYPDAVAIMPGYTGASAYDEYFMVENRHRVANDTNGYNNGMLIWHIDATPNAAGTDFAYDNSYTGHKVLRLMEADGAEEIESPGGWGGTANWADFYRRGKEFTPYSFPDSDAYDGAATGVGVTDFSADGLTMTADFTAGYTGAGRTHYVSTTGANTPPYTNWTTAARRVEDALLQAHSGGSVVLGNGRFVLASTPEVHRNVSVRSQNGTAATTIDAAGLQGLYLQHARALVSGITITNGYASYGGGACVDYGTLSNCVVLTSYAEVAGGGVYLYDDASVLRECTVSGNESADNGGGIYCENGGDVRECNVTYNLAARDGGGVDTYGAYVYGCVIVGNVAVTNGGGLRAHGQNDIVFNDLAANDAESGGGAYIEADDEVEECQFSDNTAYWGGGVHTEYGGLVSACWLARNTSYYYGGGAYLWDGGELVNCVAIDNQSQNDGGGVYIDGSGTVQNSTVCDNSADYWGGGVCTYGGGLLRNTILYYNTAAVSGNNWYNDGNGAFYDSCCLTALPPTAYRANCKSTAPAFADRPADDYRLTAASPCVDAGSPAGAPASDWDYVSRPLDGNADGTALTDIGAYEFVHPTADSDGDGLSDEAELYTYYTSPVQRDSDTDGFEDGDEAVAGTDPLDAASYLSLVTPASAWIGSGFVVEWSSVTGRNYVVLRGTNIMNTGSFTPVSGVIPGLSGTTRFTDTTIGGRSECLYRVRIQ